MIHIALFAGEPSGDQLGAELIKALKSIDSNIYFDGVGGPLMKAEGFNSILPIEDFSVMGLTEIVKNLPRLFRYKKQLLNHYLDKKPNVFVGIDYPEFNLRLEKSLKEKGIFTAHYVSPSVWAWREKRIHDIKASCDLMLTLFPFEKMFYDKHRHPAVHCGHPLVDILDKPETLLKKQKQAREYLSLPQSNTYCLSILPGSRKSEVERLLPDFLEVANLLKEKLLREDKQLHCLIPIASSHLSRIVENLIAQYKVGFSYQIILPKDEKNMAKLAMTASDVVLLASGTASLEAMLLDKPMIVAYKVSAVTAFIAKRLLVADYFALPNILAEKPIVTEYIQDAINPDKMAEELFELLTDEEKFQSMKINLLAASDQLKPNGAKTAAQALYQQIENRL